MHLFSADMQKLKSQMLCEFALSFHKAQHTSEILSSDKQQRNGYNGAETGNGTQGV